MRRIINCLFIPLFTIITVLAVFFKINYNQIQKDNSYTLKAYRNTVALYNGDNVIEIYDGVVLNSLPAADIYNFSNGIEFESRDKAEKYLEDFDT